METYNNTERAIIRALLDNGACSKEELCRLTSSSWAAVSKYVSGLLKKGILESLPPEKTSSAGRPAGKIDISPTLLSAGISVSYGKVQVVICNSKGDIIKFRGKSISREDDPVPECIKLLENLMTSEIKKRIISLGVSFPGIIDPQKQTVESSVYFSEFLNRKVAEEFEIALQMDIPIVVERNAVCELFGILKEQKLRDDTLLISLNSGLSAALFLDGKILDGKTGNLAMLGHFPDMESEIPCLCGKSGCIDTAVGEVAWTREFRKISKLPGAGDSFYQSIESGMPQAIKMLKKSLNSLPLILNPILMLFEPENIIFCAEMPPSSALVFSTLMEEEKQFDVPNIRLAGDPAAAKGGAFLGMMQLFKE